MTRLAAVPDAPRRMIVYVRQSVEREGSISPEVQERACRDHIARRGDEVAAVISDVGVSGLKWDKRPGIQRAMRMIPGEADGIVVWRWSRLSRKRLHQAVALDAIERAGGVVESATEPFDATTAGGRFSREVMLAAAAMESEQKAEQWADAHRRRRERGLPANGGERFGYLHIGGKYGPDPRTGKSAPEAYIPDPETGPILAECYRRYLGGQGMEQIADWLNALGLPSPRRGSQGWSMVGLAYMLDTGFGAGKLHHYWTRDYEQGAQEPVIDEVTWKAYRAERARRKTVPPRLLRPTWQLAGVVKCGHCGAALSVRSTATGIRVRCAARRCEAGPAPWRADVEAAVLAWLPTVATEVERLAASMPRMVVKTERARLARSVADADRALRNLLVDNARTKVPATVFDAAVAELTVERDQAQRLLDKADAESVSLDEAVRMAGRLMEVWASAEPVEVNAMVRNLLRVQVYRLTRGTNQRQAKYRIDVRGVWEGV